MNEYNIYVDFIYEEMLIVFHSFHYIVSIALIDASLLDTHTCSLFIHAISIAIERSYQYFISFYLSRGISILMDMDGSKVAKRSFIRYLAKIWMRKAKHCQ